MVITSILPWASSRNCVYPPGDCSNLAVYVLFKKCDECGDDNTLTYCILHAAVIFGMTLGCKNCGCELPPITLVPTNYDDVDMSDI